MQEAPSERCEEDAEWAIRAFSSSLICQVKGCFSASSLWQITLASGRVCQNYEFCQSGTGHVEPVKANLHFSGGCFVPFSLFTKFHHWISQAQVSNLEAAGCDRGSVNTHWVLRGGVWYHRASG